MRSTFSRWLAAPCLAGLVFALGCSPSTSQKTPPSGTAAGSKAVAGAKDPLAPTVVEIKGTGKLEPTPPGPTTVVVAGSATPTADAPVASASKPVVVKEVTESITVPTPSGSASKVTVTVTPPAAVASATPAASGAPTAIKLAPNVDVKLAAPSATAQTKVEVKVETTKPAEVKKPDAPPSLNVTVPQPAVVGRVEIGSVNPAPAKKEEMKKEEIKKEEAKKEEPKKPEPEKKVETEKKSEVKKEEPKKEEAKKPETKPATETKPTTEAKPAAETKPAAKAEAKAPVVVALAETKAPAAASAAVAASAEAGFIPPQAALAGKSSVAAPVVGVKKSDWNQWGGSSVRNNIPEGKNIATEWSLGKTYEDSNEFVKEEASKNVLWGAALGSQTYGNPVVANGQVYVGTNNGKGWLKRFPEEVDLGCLLAFDEKDGKFLWQHSSEKLATGRVHDWPLQGICCSPLVEGDKVWFVSSRGLVICLDAKGFQDGEDDGPFTKELARLFDVVKPEDPALDKVEPMLTELKAGKLPEAMNKLFAAAGEEVPAGVTVTPGKRPSSWIAKYQRGGAERTVQLQMEGPRLAVYKELNTSDKDEADVIWQLDMMNELGISQHNMCSCSVTAAGNILFVCTSNGVDEGHINLPAPNAPSFIALDKTTGKLLWKDSRPGTNILHGQWSSPAYAVIDGTPQIIFAGGDGWLYSFKGDEGKDGKPELLWSFDANPKTSKYILGGRGTRNEIIATPVIYNDLVYLAVGQDPEHGEGIGHLWCIDPKKRGDISAELAFNLKDPNKPIPHKRMQAVDEAAGEVARPNPNSGVVWHYSQFDKNNNKKIAWEEEMHRTCGTVAIKDDLLYIADFSGLFHCVDAKTGVPYWTHDLLAACWGSAMIVDDKVYMGDEEGKISIFKHSKEYEEPIIASMVTSVYTTPVVANNKLFISNKSHLFAIGPNEGEGEKKEEK